MSKGTRRLYEGGGGSVPLGGMPSISVLAFARAVCASWGREVRIREAERGRGREAESGSSGMGGEVEGEGGEGGMMLMLLLLLEWGFWVVRGEYLFLLGRLAVDARG